MSVKPEEYETLSAETEKMLLNGLHNEQQL
jgi:hypothetical protein